MAPPPNSSGEVRATEPGPPLAKDATKTLAICVEPSSASMRLHRFAQRYNWDSGLAGLEAILADPMCDVGTALLIYWMGGPGYYSQYPSKSEVLDHELPAFQFLGRLATRLVARDFAAASIRFDPRSDEKGYDWTMRYDDIKVARSIPAELLEPSCRLPRGR